MTKRNGKGGGVARALAVVGWLLVAQAPGAGAGEYEFDCMKARAPDEAAICANPRLHALDGLVSALYLRYMDGLEGMSRVGMAREDQRRHLRARRACGGDVRCIERVLKRRIPALADGLRERVREEIALIGEGCDTPDIRDNDEQVVLCHEDVAHRLWRLTRTMTDVYWQFRRVLRLSGRRQQVARLDRLQRAWWERLGRCRLADVSCRLRAHAKGREILLERVRALAAR
jgi:uncharacterized protein